VNIFKKIKAQHLLNKGIDYLVKGEIDKGINLLKESIELDQKNYLAFQNLASGLIQKGEYNDALLHLKTAVELAPKNPINYLLSAYAAFNLDNFDEANSNLKKAEEIDPLNPFNFYLKGLLYLKQDEINKCLEELKKYVVFNKSESLARILLAAEIIILKFQSDSFQFQNLSQTVKKSQDKNSEYTNALKAIMNGNLDMATESLMEYLINRKKSGESHALARVLLASELFILSSKNRGAL